jgi:cyclic pyranopterin monophosphate synthase
VDHLTHVDDDGRARMVPVGGKPSVSRVARARGHIALTAEARRLIAENALKKGDVLTTAELAGIQAAKRTSELIPLCHNLLLDHVRVVARLDDAGVLVESEAACTGPTGVEMEALTAVAVALLTVYDMCKAVDRTMVIGEVVLLEKHKADPA